MSTTNPPAGPNNPGGDPLRPPGTQPPGPSPGQWPADVGDLSAPDSAASGPGVNPDAIRAGHEPDAFAVKPILSIPVAVVVTFVVAFVVAAGAFAYFSGRDGERGRDRFTGPYAHPEAVARGEKGLNDRLERTEREGFRPNDRREVDQPRLEPLKRLEGDGLFYARPVMPTGNSPEIHWENIRPDRVPGLQKAGYADGKKEFARIPIADAMRLAVANKDMFPVQKDASKPIRTGDWPNAANAGRGAIPPVPIREARENPGTEPVNPGPPKAPAPKPGEPKPPEKK